MSADNPVMVRRRAQNERVRAWRTSYISPGFSLNVPSAFVLCVILCILPSVTSDPRPGSLFGRGLMAGIQEGISNVWSRASKAVDDSEERIARFLPDVSRVKQWIQRRPLITTGSQLGKRVSEWLGSPVIPSSRDIKLPVVSMSKRILKLKGDTGQGELNSNEFRQPRDEDLRNLIKQNAQTIKNTLQTGKETLKTVLTQAVNDKQEELETLKNTITTQNEAIKNTIVTSKDEIRNALNTAINDKEVGLQAVKDQLDTVKDTIAAEIIDAQTGIKVPLKDLKGAIQTQIQAVKGILDTSKQNINAQFQTTKSDIKAALETASADIKQAYNQGRETVKQQVDVTKNNFKNQMQLVKAAIDTTKDQVKQQLNAKRQAIKAQLDQQKQEFKNNVQQVKNEFKNKVNRIKQDIKDKIDQQGSFDISFGIAGLVVALSLPFPAAVLVTSLPFLLSILTDLGLIGLILGLTLPLYGITAGLAGPVDSIEICDEVEDLRGIRGNNGLNGINGFNGLRRQDGKKGCLPSDVGIVLNQAVVEQLNPVLRSVVTSAFRRRQDRIRRQDRNRRRNGQRNRKGQRNRNRQRNRNGQNNRRRNQNHGNNQNRVDHIPKIHIPPSNTLSSDSNYEDEEDDDNVIPEWFETTPAPKVINAPLLNAYKTGPSAYHEWYRTQNGYKKHHPSHTAHHPQHQQYHRPQKPKYRDFYQASHPVTYIKTLDSEPSGAKDIPDYLNGIDYTASPSEVKFHKFYESLISTTPMSADITMAVEESGINEVAAIPTVTRHRSSSTPSQIRLSPYSIPKAPNSWTLVNASDSMEHGTTVSMEYSSGEVTPFTDYDPRWKPVS